MGFMRRIRLVHPGWVWGDLDVISGVLVYGTYWKDAVWHSRMVADRRVEKDVKMGSGKDRKKSPRSCT